MKLHRIAHLAQLTLARSGPRPLKSRLAEVLGRALGVGGDAKRPTLNATPGVYPGLIKIAQAAKYVLRSFQALVAGSATGACISCSRANASSQGSIAKNGCR